MRIPPHVICEWLGHAREGYDAWGFRGPDGRWHMRRHSRCKRCGTSDGGEVFRFGRLEWLHPWRLRMAWFDARARIGAWWRTDCDDCHKPERRFGRAVGDHRGCNPIPF